MAQELCSKAIFGNFVAPQFCHFWQFCVHKITKIGNFVSAVPIQSQTLSFCDFWQFCAHKNAKITKIEGAINCQKWLLNIHVLGFRLTCSVSLKIPFKRSHHSQGMELHCQELIPQLNSAIFVMKCLIKSYACLTNMLLLQIVRLSKLVGS